MMNANNFKIGLFLSLLLNLAFIQSCKKTNAFEINEKALILNQPGDNFGFVELKNVVLDSFQQPINYSIEMGYLPVLRTDHQKIDRNAVAKIYFAVKNEQYCWRLREGANNYDSYWLLSKVCRVVLG